MKLPNFLVTHRDLLGAPARPDVPNSEVCLRDFTACFNTTPEEALRGGGSVIIGADAGEAAARACKEIC